MMRGETVYVEGVAVDNVLVRPGEHVDGTDVTVPAGAVIAYTLAFPASYPGSISDAKVTVRGHTCDSIGFCDHTRPQDVFEGLWDLDVNPWDMTVPVQLCEGDLTAFIRVLATSSTYGADGRPIRTIETVFEGQAQARVVDANESSGVDGSKQAYELWAFVIPWTGAFARLRPESTTVIMGDAAYDAISIKNLGGKSEWACISATRSKSEIGEAGDTGETGSTGSPALVGA